jgi:hypothetical protein
MGITPESNVPSALAGWVVARNLSFSNGLDVDRTVWTSPQWTPSDNPSFFGRTAIRNPHDFGTPLGCVPVANSRAQLILSTFNRLASPPNSSFLGAQISTIEKWGLSSNPAGVAFHARVRCPKAAPGGMVTSLFSYNLRSTHPFQHDEIDFEFSSKYWTQSPAPQINTNIYLDNNAGIDQVVTANADFSQPIDFMIMWTAQSIQWFVNGVNVRTASQVPQSDMSLTLNFWVPDTTWGWAYDPHLQPGGAPGTQWIYEVDWAKVYVKS